MNIHEALDALNEEINFTLLHVDLDPEHDNEVKTALKVVGSHQALLKRLNIDNLSTYHVHVLALAEASRYFLELREDILKNIKDQESQEWIKKETRYISQTKEALKAIGFKSYYEPPRCQADIMGVSQAHDSICTVFENIVIEMTIDQKEIKQEGAEILAQGCADMKALLVTRYYKDLITMFDSALLVKAYLTDHH